MSSNKSINRFFLILVTIYVVANLCIGFFFKGNLPVQLTLLIPGALILTASFLYLWFKKISIKELIPFKKIKFSTCILVIVCTCLIYPLMILLNALTLFFVKSGTLDVVTRLSNGSFLLTTLFMAILPAFSEEFLFRGILFGTYKKSKMLPAVFLSAFLFGCMHMNFNQFLYAFVLGIYLALLVEATGSIFSSMLAHFTLNFISVIAAYATKGLQSIVTTAEADNITGIFLETMDKSSMFIMVLGILFWFVIAIGTTAGAFGVYIGICKICRRWDHVKGMFRTGDRKRLITIPLVIAILIMITMMVVSAVKI